VYSSKIVSTDQIGWFTDREQWEKLRTIAMVEAERHIR